MADDDDGDGVYDYGRCSVPRGRAGAAARHGPVADGTAMYVSNWFGDLVQKFDLTDPFNLVLEDTVSQRTRTCCA